MMKTRDLDQSDEAIDDAQSAAPIYFGISGATLPVEQFDLGHGLVLSQTYAHLMAPYIMAFAPAKPGAAHPGPWCASSGGFGYDVTIQLAIEPAALPTGLPPRKAGWWILALLRIAHAPYLFAPVTIDTPFGVAARASIEPKITPLEIETPRSRRPDHRDEALEMSWLAWLAANWVEVVTMMNAHPKALAAFEALDSCRALQRGSVQMLTIWGGLEQLFAPSAGELRFRVAANLASYLEPRGPKRQRTFKTVLKLYNERSAAAHTTADIEVPHVMQSWVLLRNALMKMINERKVPGQGEFEHLLFADDAPTDPKALSWGAGD
jgi:hypothetical protein